MVTTYVRTSDHVRVNEVEVYKPAAMIALTVSGGATPSDTSTSMNVRGAKDIVVEVDHNQVGSASTSMTATVYTSEDDTVWDNLAYASVLLGAAQVKTIVVTPGMKYMKVYLANADAANATKVLPRVVVTY